MALTVKSSDVERFKHTWLALQEELHTDHWKIGKLANDIRRIFPEGTTGDVQFQLFIKEELGKLGCRGPIMLAKSIAFEQFPQQQWVRFGGWAGVGFLSALRNVDRYKVIGALPGKGPYHYSTIIKRAKVLGVMSKQPQGRLSESETNQKFHALQDYVYMIQNMHIPGLPPLPAAILAALPAAKRARLSATSTRA